MDVINNTRVIFNTILKYSRGYADDMRQQRDCEICSIERITIREEHADDMRQQLEYSI